MFVVFIVTTNIALSTTIIQSFELHFVVIFILWHLLMFAVLFSSPVDSCMHTLHVCVLTHSDPGEWGGGERPDWGGLWVGVQWDGVPGGGCSGPAHAGLLPHAQPQLRACHRERLLAGGGRGARCREQQEEQLSTTHQHHCQNHPEQHRFVRISARRHLWLTEFIYFPLISGPWRYTVL